MHHRQSNDDDNYADLVDGTIVTVRTTKSPKLYIFISNMIWWIEISSRRMQYPSAKLQDAVTAVLKGKMNIKQAAECHGVPRSTVQRRIR
jgi:transcriptional regulator of acetoin/glycerol metabolism